MLQCDAVRAVDDSIGATGRSVLQSVAVCLQSAIVCCYELQSDAVWCCIHSSVTAGRVLRFVPSVCVAQCSCVLQMRIIDDSQFLEL